MSFRMQIIIPMSGYGERFRQAGYKTPKPLIEIEGKPLIAHVIDMFPGETDFIFICNEDHLNTPEFQMKNILKAFAPTGKVIGIPSHKFGPGHAVLQAKSLIDPERPTVINYCDFTCFWDWEHFKKFVSLHKCDGALPAYRGFHPHSLGPTNYAYIRENEGWAQDIQEKQPYTQNRMNEFASSGTYFFATGKLALDAVQKTVEQNLKVNGEYYISLAYKPLFQENKKIAVYPLQHFMQWGTPEDVREYQNWSAIFRRALEPEKPLPPQGSMIMPMAGLGQRFADAGYKLAKPLIPVSGKAMVLQAARDLPPSLQQVFVLRKDMPQLSQIIEKISETYPGAEKELLPKVSDGQARSALLGLEKLSKLGNIPCPIIFGTCDNGFFYNQKSLTRWLNDSNVDVLVWGIRGHTPALRHPQMFGWLDVEGDVIRSVSVKKPLASPTTDPIVTGTFIFKKESDFKKCVDRLFKRNGRINGEFYLDSAINDALSLGLRCHLFEVDHYISWGTPEALETFEYWQSCFHKWKSHPYRLELDARVNRVALPELENRFQQITPELGHFP